MAEIKFVDVGKSFGDNKIIEHMNLTIKDGSFTVLVGPSGCGKTTLLRMIAGIGPASSGQILLDGEDITDKAPGKRGVAMVFQNYAIYPTMTVRENIEFGLKNNHVPKEERSRLISEVALSVGLSELLDRKPSTLSGGQRQRIALARAMVKKPKVFLMDEPLSNLDAKLRVAMRTELIELYKKLQTTFVYVTHDQIEAMSMADDIVLLDHGKIQQEDAPEKIYYDPDNVFTAQFIGTPPMNIFSFGAHENRMGFRSERVTLSYQANKQAFFERKGSIITREMLGSETQYQIKIPEGSLMVKSLNEKFQVGETVYIQLQEEHLYFFDKEGLRIRDKKEIAECNAELEASHEA
ncbi:MAG: ABC transporter ATP-binding protein [Sphaerochaetaceae bacterium]|nr:ABC transporter ATP-binding protein [Spirochaetales bacterium]MDY5499699.1 ABC transporter ATP-binding protein [Sphaerochaetaceae bacterium]